MKDLWQIHVYVLCSTELLQRNATWHRALVSVTRLNPALFSVRFIAAVVVGVICGRVVHARLGGPDVARVLLDGSVARKRTHAARRLDGHRRPRLTVEVCRIRALHGIHVCIPIASDHVQVLLRPKAVQNAHECAGVSKCATSQSLHDASKSTWECSSVSARRGCWCGCGLLRLRRNVRDWRGGGGGGGGFCVGGGGQRWRWQRVCD
mmetsp:Transcript_599/g.1238  ORF Transcript_599/g.1238 Transcript_599/m.1238 type:complete len:207 (+) Transcript_599:38-658(+)